MGKIHQGPTSHAEGKHGRKSHARIIEQLESGPAELPSDERAHPDQTRASDGERRLVEDREQHDEAEKNSAAQRREGLPEKDRR